MSSFDSSAMRFSVAVLGLAASATAYGFLGMAILQSDHPQTTACMAASGLLAFFTPLFLGGLGVLFAWAHAELKGLRRERSLRWFGRPLNVSAGLARDLIGLAIVASVLGCFITFGNAALGGYQAALRVADGACPAEAAQP